LAQFSLVSDKPQVTEGCLEARQNLITTRFNKSQDSGKLRIPLALASLDILARSKAFCIHSSTACVESDNNR